MQRYGLSIADVVEFDFWSWSPAVWGTSLLDSFTHGAYRLYQCVNRLKRRITGKEAMPDSVALKL